MRDACNRMPPQRHLRAKVSTKRIFYLSEKYSLSYCRVPESGSTYWAQAFLTLAGINPQWHDYGDAKTMFDVPEHAIAGAIKRRASLIMTYGDDRIRKTTSFLVARNPYTRLFSAYINSIYLPNRWHLASTMVQEPKRRECGTDVSFDEFLTHVSNNLLKKRYSDLNWAPIFTICLPCETNIDIVAKEETFSEDTDFILHYAGVEENTREQITGASILDYNQIDLNSQIHMYVTKGQNVNRGCITEETLAERIWTAFQIQGYIHNDMRFPRDDFKSILRDDLKDVLSDLVLKKSNEEVLTFEERVKQIRDWKINFWKSVSLETIRNIQAAYYEDFVLFGYDIDPHSM